MSTESETFRSGKSSLDDEVLQQIVEGRSALSNEDQILAVVRYLARAWRKSDSVAFLTAGLPLVDGRMTPELIAPSFARIGVSVHPVVRELRELAEFEMPAIVEHGGQLLVVLRREGRRAFRCFDPVENAERVFSAKEVGWRHRRELLIVTPNFEMASDAAGSRFARSGHWFWAVALGHGRSLAYVLVAAALINIFAVAFPLFSMNVYDRVLPNSAESTLWVLAVGLALVLLFDTLLKLARGAVIEHVGRRMDFLLSSALFDRVLNTSMEARPASTGAFVNRIAQYEVLRDFFASSTLVMFVDILFLGIFAYVIASLVGWLVVFPLAAGAIGIVVSLAIGLMSGRYVRSALSESSARNSVLVEALTGSQSVKAARAEGQMLRRWEASVLSSSETQHHIKYYQSLATNLTAALSQLSMAGIIIGGTYLFAAHQISMGAIIAAMMLSNRLIAPISLIAATLLKTRSAMEAYKSVNTIMKLPDERGSASATSTRTISKGRVAFNKVRFAYPGSKTFVLDGVSFSVEAGEKVGIIGRIGSGKTTLSRLMLRFYRPTEGEILVDGADVDQFHPADLRRSIGLVLQDPELFNGSVRDNILLSDPGASEERMLAAAEKAGVDQFVSRHPQGYDMPVGERGILLSGGQRQAVALARTMLVEPKILFLDEPSSSMDLATERQLIKHLEGSLTPDQTVLIATHRYSLLSLVTRLLVIDNGRLIADGPRDQVLAQLRSRGEPA